MPVALSTVPCFSTTAQCPLTRHSIPSMQCIWIRDMMVRAEVLRNVSVKCCSVPHAPFSLSLLDCLIPILSWRSAFLCVSLEDANRNQSNYLSATMTHSSCSSGEARGPREHGVMPECIDLQVLCYKLQQTFPCQQENLRLPCWQCHMLLRWICQMAFLRESCRLGLLSLDVA